MTENLYPHVKCPECQLLFTPEAHDDKIKDLESENQRLRDALDDIVHTIYSNEATLQYIEQKARAALGEK